jgi:hypothetical protein
MIPKAALGLGLAGLVPFVACAVALLTGWPMLLVGREALIMVHYGIIILAFMSGVLWGFATRAAGRAATIGYALSVLPALWAFLTTLGPTSQALTALIIGYLGLLGLDWHFWRLTLAPPWWLRLRLILSAGVLASLAVGVYA